MEAQVYRIVFSPRADRDFHALAPETQRRLKPRIDALGRNPRPRSVRPLNGEERFLRLRAGDYRIVYQVQGRILTVLILKIGHRRGVPKAVAARRP